MNRIDLVGHHLGTLVTEENRPSYGVSSALAHLHPVTEEFKTGPQLGQDLSLRTPDVARESISARCSATTAMNSVAQAGGRDLVGK